MIKYKLFENFLDEDDNKSLVDLALNIEEWKESVTFNDNQEYWRKSKCLNLKREECSVLMDKIEPMFKELHKEFYGKLLTLEDTEIQITRSHDGDFYKPHPDTALDGYLANRRITYVYYIHKTPKQFINGNIRIYNHVDNPVQGRQYKFNDYVEFEPNNNTLLMFPSHQWHEVLPVRCALDYTSSRFTINGWLH